MGQGEKLCCRCNSKNCWLDNMYCFECYMVITSMNSQLPKNIKNKE